MKLLIHPKEILGLSKPEQPYDCIYNDLDLISVIDDDCSEIMTIRGISGPVICEKCQKNGEKSKTILLSADPSFVKDGTPPEFKFWDESGKHHRHSKYVTFWHYKCDKGHEWNKSLDDLPCPTCGWDWKKEEPGT